MACKWDTALFKHFNKVAKIIGVTCFMLVLCYSYCIAQQPFLRWDSIQVIIAGDTIDNPWAGGFNNPQFSDIDLNGDGIQDLFVFDRSGNRVLTFLNNGSPNKVDYIHTPEFQSKFPDLYSYALLIDYNNDGKEDIFTSAYRGIRVYRNDYNVGDSIKFTLADTLIYADDILLYVGEWDIPAITDVDSDGDIDILTFDFAGTYMVYYKNLSIEKYGKPDSLDYTEDDSCWGVFAEDFNSNKVFLDSCTTNKKKTSLHAGSTTLALDLNGDKAKEIIVGDITFTNAYMLNNGGDSMWAHMVGVNENYPLTKPINMYKFPAAYYEDVNNDGLSDLLAAPNALSVSENFTCSWYYKNIGSNLLPDFDFQTNAFLQEDMIEVGEGAHPVFFDFNSDGLLDIIIGNYGYYSNSGTYPSGLSFYRNSGTLKTPVFELITRDLANIFSLGFLDVYPSFGDLDGDGDKDMIIGESEGNIHFFKNTAGKGNPANFVLEQPFYKSIDVGECSTPQIIDMNCDGKLDLLIGERNGNLNYYKNTGDKTKAEFTLITGTFGGVDVKNGSITGYSVPLLTILDENGDHTLLVGSEEGSISQYLNIDDNLKGNFTLVDPNILGVREGERASISGGDLNGDGKIDLVVGNYGGGIAIYKNQGDSIPPQPPCPLPISSFSVSIFPNPANDNCEIQILGARDDDIVEITIYNTIGQRVFFNKYEADSEMLSLNTKIYSNGVYFCNIEVINAQGSKDNSVMIKLAVIK